MASSYSDRWHTESLGNHHDRSQFKSGEESLDDFLRKLATQHRKRNLGQTYVAVALDQTYATVSPGESRVLGYYTIAVGSVTFDLLPDSETRGLPKHMRIPVMHLGRLAVDQSVQGQGLGSHLLIDALHRGHKIAKEVGMHAVEVEAISEKARQFYVKYGFVELQDDHRHLYMSFKTVAKLFPDDTNESK